MIREARLFQRSLCLAPFVAAATMCTPFKDDLPVGPDGASMGGPGAQAPATFDAGPRCNVNKPFGKATLVPGLTAVGMTSVAGVRLSPDSLTAYFEATGRPKSAGYSDLYTATRESLTTPFGDIKPFVGTGINTPDEEFDPTLSGDGLTLVFGRSYPNDIPVDLFYAVRATAFIPLAMGGRVFEATTPDRSYDTSPFLREDGRILYFASTRDSTTDTDIFRMSVNGSRFGAPTRVDELNTNSAEMAPVVTPDDLVVYFGSDRGDGGALGQYDIWMAQRASTMEPFSALMNVTEVNSPDSDLPSFVTSDRCTLYFSSTRSGALSAYVATKVP